MNSLEIRLECLKMVLTRTPQTNIEDVVKSATLLEVFVQGQNHQQPCNTDDKA
jgi:hypothetical protein